MLTIGDRFPDFNLVAVKGGPDGLAGPGETFEEISKNFDPEKSFTYISSESDPEKWKVIFFWPKDFTFVCPTEVIEYDRFFQDFLDRNAVLYGCSTDSEFAHLFWRVYHKELQHISIPLLSDMDRKLSETLGILDKKMKVDLRATFIVDPAGIIRWVSVHDLSVGRNPKEALRVLDALQTGELCVANWEKGDPTIVPQEIFNKAIDLIDDSLKQLFKQKSDYEIMNALKIKK